MSAPATFLSIPDACKAMSISRSHLYRMADKGKIRIVKLLSKSVVPRADIDRLLPPYQEPVGELVGEPPKPKVKKVVLFPRAS